MAAHWLQAPQLLSPMRGDTCSQHLVPRCTCWQSSTVAQSHTRPAHLVRAALGEDVASARRGVVEGHLRVGERHEALDGGQGLHGVELHDEAQQLEARLPGTLHLGCRQPCLLQALASLLMCDCACCSAACAASCCCISAAAAACACCAGLATEPTAAGEMTPLAAKPCEQRELGSAAARLELACKHSSEVAWAHCCADASQRPATPTQLIFQPYNRMPGTPPLTAPG